MSSEEERPDQPEADRAAFGGHHPSGSVPACRGTEGRGLSWAPAEVHLGTSPGIGQNPGCGHRWGQSSGWKRGESPAEAPPSAATHSPKAQLTSRGERWPGLGR